MASEASGASWVPQIHWPKVLAIGTRFVLQVAMASVIMRLGQRHLNPYVPNEMVDDFEAKVGSSAFVMASWSVRFMLAWILYTVMFMPSRFLVLRLYSLVLKIFPSIQENLQPVLVEDEQVTDETVAGETENERESEIENYSREASSAEEREEDDDYERDLDVNERRPSPTASTTTMGSTAESMMEVFDDELAYPTRALRESRKIMTRQAARQQTEVEPDESNILGSEMIFGMGTHSPVKQE